MADKWNVHKTEESGEDEAFAPLQFEIVNYPADITLKGYYEQWQNKQLLVPPFQRDYVWDVKRASKLIESFFLGLPVPGVFLFRPKNSNVFQIVDGQQRILSVVHFLEGHFGESVFRLKGVQSGFDGKRFVDLSDALRFKLETTVLRATIIQQLSPDDDTSVYQIFERLNTGGMNLNPMEIRQSVSFGPFVSLLKDLNRDVHWRALVGQAVPDKRLRDVELVLRILALYQHRQDYEKPMKEFLNKFMEFKRKKSDDYDNLSDSFIFAVKKAHDLLGPMPFHLRKRLNYGVMDSVLVALLIDPKIDNLKEKFENLLLDRDYIQAVSFNTSDAGAIDVRLSKAISYLS